MRLCFNNKRIHNTFPLCRMRKSNSTRSLCLTLWKITESHYHLMLCIKRMDFICIVKQVPAHASFIHFSFDMILFYYNRYLWVFSQCISTYTSKFPRTMGKTKDFWLVWMEKGSRFYFVTLLFFSSFGSFLWLRCVAFIDNVVECLWHSPGKMQHNSAVSNFKKNENKSLQRERERKTEQEK